MSACAHRYQCMQTREVARQAAHATGAVGPAAVKYYGKWPFRRVLGMQAGGPACPLRESVCKRADDVLSHCRCNCIQKHS